MQSVLNTQWESRLAGQRRLTFLKKAFANGKSGGVAPVRPTFGHQRQWSSYQQVNDVSEQPWHLKSIFIVCLLEILSVGSHLLQLEHRSPSAQLPYLARAPPQTSPGPLRHTSPPQGPGPDPNWQEFGWLAGRGV